MLQDMIEHASYMAHGYCLLWKPWLVSLHAGSDILIAGAYFAIPAAIWIFVSRRPDLEMKGLARLFAAFILWCGVTHLFNLATLWWPIYELQGAVKAVTAAVSVVTAIVIFPLIPKALAIPSPRQLQRANEELQNEIAAHRQTLNELQGVQAELEKRVQERTRELREASDRFRTLFAHAPVAMVMVDRAGRLELANDAAERVFGYGADEILGKPIEDLLPPARRSGHAQLRETYLRTPSARPMGVGRELHGLRKSGEEFPVEIGLNPMNLGGEQTSVVASIIDISARRKAEQRLQFILRELSHRSKNLLALLQGIVRQTARSAASVESFEKHFSERLQGLARSHELLVQRNWQGAPLDGLVRSQLAFVVTRDDSTVSIEGPPVTLAPAATQNIGLALHELATNAVKHGALSSEDGRISIRWRIEGASSRPELSLTWSEKGGRTVEGPVRRGFGRVVLEEVIPRALEGTGRLVFGAEGISWNLRAPLDHLTSQELEEA